MDASADVDLITFAEAATGHGEASDHSSGEQPAPASAPQAAEETAFHEPPEPASQDSASDAEEGTASPSDRDLLLYSLSEQRRRADVALDALAAAHATAAAVAQAHAVELRGVAAQCAALAARAALAPAEALLDGADCLDVSDLPAHPSYDALLAAATAADEAALSAQLLACLRGSRQDTSRVEGSFGRAQLQSLRGLRT